MDSNRNYKFAFVSNSAELGELVKCYADPSTEDLVIKLATMEEAVSVAREFLDEGVEVILGGGGTGSLLARTLGQPIVKIARTYADIVRALIKAKKYGSYIGLTSFATPTDGIEIFEDLLSIKIRQIVFNTTEELINGISVAFDEGVKCIVGGGVCKKIITSLGGVGIIVLPSKSVILQALREARAIASVRRREQEDVAQLRTILETIKEGVIVIDKGGKVKIFNQMAADIFGTELKERLGEPLPNVIRGTGLLKVLKTGLPEIDIIRRVGDVDIVINTIPIVISGEIFGVVATFKEAARIQNIDRKLKEKLYIKGFVTKHTIDHIKGESLIMRQLLDRTRKYATTDATILIQGETGTGKEIFAQSMHNLSDRKGKPFVAVNCSALPESLLESELFGYEEGAFTGAKKGGKIGLFEMATGGTIFLDEIADIPSSLQVRLLRVLEEKEVMRIGGDRIVPVDVRIISSTYKDLREEVNLGKFRADLYFRLAVLKLDIPPLRKRPEDIPFLVQEILYKYGRGTKRISDKMVDRMKGYNWPGNIRELDSLIKRYVVLLGNLEADDNLLYELLHELNDSRGIATKKESIIHGELQLDTAPRTLKERLEEYEKIVIEETLKETQFNKRETAKRLGISANTLWRKLPQSDTSH